MIQFVQLSHPKRKPTYVRGGFVDEEKKRGGGNLSLFYLVYRLNCLHVMDIICLFLIRWLMFFFFRLVTSRNIECSYTPKENCTSFVCEESALLKSVGQVGTQIWLFSV